jgi:dimethylargininase
MHVGFARTVERLKELGFAIETIDISELLKAEAGLTCSSIIFENRT